MHLVYCTTGEEFTTFAFTYYRKSIPPLYIWWNSDSRHSGSNVFILWDLALEVTHHWRQKGDKHWLFPSPLPNDIFSRTKKEFRWQRLKSGGETAVGDITFERRDDRASPPPQLLPIENFFPICQKEQISNVNSSVVVFVRWADGSDSSSDAISKLPFKHLSFGSNTSNCAEELSFFKLAIWARFAGPVNSVHLDTIKFKFKNAPSRTLSSQFYHYNAVLIKIQTLLSPDTLISQIY